MTERKPAGVSWESWVERQIREAMERGEFDDLPGVGQPLPNIDQPYDPMWWLKEKLRRENVSVRLRPSPCARSSRLPWAGSPTRTARQPCDRSLPRSTSVSL